MSNDADFSGRTLGDPRPQHHGGRRVTRSAARRLLDGTPHGRDNVVLVELLAAVTAPPEPQERSAPGLEEALRAFEASAFEASGVEASAVEAGAGAAASSRTGGGRARAARRSRRLAVEPGAGVDAGTRASGGRARAPRGSRGLAVKLAAAVLLASGVGAAVAGAGALPAPMQRLAHAFLGGVGVPAPSTTGARPGTPSAGATSGPAQTGSPSASPNASPSALVVLCQTVALDGSSWHKDLDNTDRATLSDAAGGDGKVVAYCETLLAETNGTGTVTPSASPSAPSATTSTAHGGGHPTQTKSANPHSTAH